MKFTDEVCPEGCEFITAKPTRKYRVVESVDPYHSRLYYRGEKVLCYDLATPVKWLISEHDTEDEAKETLWEIALFYAENDDCIHYENDDSINAWRESLKEDGIKDNLEWYEGEGIYVFDCNGPMLLKGGSSFEIDVEQYSIEEYEPITLNIVKGFNYKISENSSSYYFLVYNAKCIFPSENIGASLVKVDSKEEFEVLLKNIKNIDDDYYSIPELSEVRLGDVFESIYHCAVTAECVAVPHIHIEKTRDI